MVQDPGTSRKDGKSVARRQKDLSPRARWLLIGAAAVEAGLKTAALLDLRRRPAAEIRGSKRAWSVAMLANSAGLIPAAYFLVGIRRDER